ncbi:hypothetical protein DICPUDRAFT_155404 [Dictyostelium purpureum]|uniref:Spermatogenesis-associated protein 20-like TRX domain-containing protein n=1 Tax=Dictyostelium purpureum TaxID=5786 RepID=F0ZTX0_DICPU|nr:uncharacterized protein DICPUDRAFT_155404 [Dictyostelium purpureum]EGC32616.1 hypothetical protein DICPUDRAFT_155404 [Dictyostelium purpureum]|eukprot:XP_003290868.1 hypothetical protein DICPUDRAFT_155404 [Dictyostelium purpureum]
MSKFSTTTTNKEYKYTNKLINEKSPYLIKHAHDPVNWYPWCDEAFELAKKQDKLIFLSVGYMACHWCSVMHKECFENPSISKVMNDLFINIKVDREERPDIDKLYMTFLTETTGGGGWPMSIWLTPSLQPISAGTYFAPEPKFGRAAFPELCKKLNEIWKNDRETVIERGNSFIEYLKEDKPKGNLDNALSEETVSKCIEQILKGYDPDDGGFTDAPKFPRCSIFNFLLSASTQEQLKSSKESILEKLFFTLSKMAYGGIYDQIGFGFHRYSVTPDWKIPHFEKMLYDQGQLVPVYLDSYILSKNELFKNISKSTLKYVQNYLTHKDGGFFSAEDADSFNESNEKSEGAFYIWNFEDIKKALENDKEAIEIYSFIYGLVENGNVNPKDDPHNEFIDKNIIMRIKSNQDAANYFKKSTKEIESSLESSRKKLLTYRDTFKPRPPLDDKIIVAWNGLMISAFARAYQIFPDEESYLESAKRATKFIKDNLYNQATKTLIRNFKDSPSLIHAFADDYASLIQGLLDLYQCTFEIEYLEWAIELQEKQDQLFYDSQLPGGYFSTSGDDKSILHRLKEEHDGAENSCQSISVSNLLKLYSVTYNQEYKEKALATLDSCSLYLEKAPIVMPQMMCSMLLCKEKENTLNSINIVINSKEYNQTKNDLKQILKQVNSLFIPNKFITVKDISDQKQVQFFNEKTKNLNLINLKPVYDKPSLSLCNPNGCSISSNNLGQITNILNNNIFF